MKILFQLMFLLFVGGTFVSAEFAYPFLGEITGQNVNIRSGGDKNFSRVAQLDNGDEIVVVEKKFGWYKIRLPEKAKAYVSADLVTPLSDGMGEISAGRVNVRSGKGTDFFTVGQLSRGQKVRIVSSEDGWYRIEPVDGLFGWVHEDLVAYKSGDVPQPPVVEVVEAKEPAVDEMAADAKPRLEVSLTGTVEPISSWVENDNVRHQLIVDGYQIYYLEGPPDILERFSQAQVKIKGLIEENPNSAYNRPVVAVSAINFVL